VKDPKVGMAIFRIGRRVTVGITFLALNSACPGLCRPGARRPWPHRPGLSLSVIVASSRLASVKHGKHDC
jgi:hypothetical protein